MRLTSTSLTAVPVRPVSDGYDRSRYDPNDPGWAQLKQQNADRLDRDAGGFKERLLTAAQGPGRTAGRFRLEVKGIKHIASRHLPEYFGFEFKQQNTFFPKGTSISKIAALITLVYRNGTLLRQNGKFVQFVGTVNGVTYVLGLNHDRVGQFYQASGSSTGQELVTQLPDDGSVIRLPAPTDPPTERE